MEVAGRNNGHYDNRIGRRAQSAEVQCEGEADAGCLHAIVRHVGRKRQRKVAPFRYRCAARPCFLSFADFGTDVNRAYSLAACS